MVQRLRSQLPILITAVVTATVFAAGPTVAQAAYDAINADKVDGKHAVGAAATPAQRAGKLVAANRSGRLPNNIIVKAPDADALDGLDSTDLRVTAGGKEGGHPNVNGCTSAVVLSYPLSLARSARISATASTQLYVDAGLVPTMTIQLVDAGGQVVARSNRSITRETAGNPTMDIGEVLLRTDGTAPYDAMPGDYTLRIHADNFGTCDNTKIVQYQAPRLTHILAAGGS